MDAPTCFAPRFRHLTYSLPGVRTVTMAKTPFAKSNPKTALMERLGLYGHVFDTE